MMRENSGKGLGAMPSLPQAFMGGRDIPIEAGASAAGLAALRAPQATGYSLGTREGKEAELASLRLRAHPVKTQNPPLVCLVCRFVAALSAGVLWM